MSVINGNHAQANYQYFRCQSVNINCLLFCVTIKNECKIFAENTKESANQNIFFRYANSNDILIKICMGPKST